MHRRGSCDTDRACPVRGGRRPGGVIRGAPRHPDNTENPFGHPRDLLSDKVEELLNQNLVESQQPLTPSITCVLTLTARSKDPRGWRQDQTPHTCLLCLLQGRWTCALCMKRREYACASGGWFHGAQAHPTTDSDTFRRKLSSVWDDIESDWVSISHSAYN